MKKLLGEIVPVDDVGLQPGVRYVRNNLDTGEATAEVTGKVFNEVTRMHTLTLVSLKGGTALTHQLCEN